MVVTATLATDRTSKPKGKGTKCSTYIRVNASFYLRNEDPVADHSSAELQFRIPSNGPSCSSLYSPGVGTCGPELRSKLCTASVYRLGLCKLVVREVEAVKII